MKKLIALALVALVSITIVGCGGDTKKPADTKAGAGDTKKPA